MPKVVDHDAYRAELVARATHLFAERGYHGLGMRAIAQALGVSKSALYHYFPSKEALFEAVTTAVVQTDLAALAAVQTERNTPRERLRALLGYCQAHEDWFVQQLTVLVDYARGKSPPEIQATPVLPDAASAYVVFVQDYLGLATRTEAVALVACINGLILQRLVDGRMTDWEALTGWLVAAFFPAD